MDITKETYRKVLRALEKGPRSSAEIQAEVGFPSPDHGSAALAKLSRNHLISRAYILTDEGKLALQSSGPTNSQEPTESLGPIAREEHAAKAIPPMPNPKVASPGFEWLFDEEQWKWVQRRKPEFRPRNPPARLFG